MRPSSLSPSWSPIGSAALSALLLLQSPAARAGDDDERWSAHVQSTYIRELKPGFSAPYSGPASLSPQREWGYSFSATAFLGWKIASGTELYFNPELVSSVPMSHLAGLAGLSNGEQQKSSGATPTLYRARLFLRQTWGLGGEKQKVEPDANALAGSVDSRRLVLTAGNFSVLDVFDQNSYAHDPRKQFLNWALTTYGAWDFAADARGYTWGAALEYDDGDWAVRYGRFLQPAQSNGLPLDESIFTHYGDQVEVAHTHKLGDLPGQVSVLVFRNRARMAAFGDAVNAGVATSTVPDLSTVRRDQSKRGVAIGVEQSVTPSLGLFARGSWNDGRTETYAFAEMERSLAVGGAVKGAAWGREGDSAGFAFVANGLSRAHQQFLEAGGIGPFIGDGRLNYRPEMIGEAYYNVRLVKNTWLGLDLQRVRNPAYNADRGPVTIAAVRLHTEF